MSSRQRSTSSRAEHEPGLLNGNDRIRYVGADVAKLARGTRYGRARTVLQIQGVACRAGRRFRYVAGVGLPIGDARVSTAEQSVDLQTDELMAAGCVKVFTEQLLGAVDRRPKLDRALEQLRAGDTLVVRRLDRLGRSLRT